MADSLHSVAAVALRAEKATEELATKLAQEGAPPEALKAVGQCADILRQISNAAASQAEPKQPRQAPAQEPAPAEQGPPQEAPAPANRRRPFAGPSRDLNEQVAQKKRRPFPPR